MYSKLFVSYWINWFRFNLVSIQVLNGTLSIYWILFTVLPNHIMSRNSKRVNWMYSRNIFSFFCTIFTVIHRVNSAAVTFHWKLQYLHIEIEQFECTQFEFHEFHQFRYLFCCNQPKVPRKRLLWWEIKSMKKKNWSE